MADLILELGVEELPASFVHRALQQMESWSSELEKQRLPHASAKTLATPRRLTWIVEGLAEAQPDREEVIMGPPWGVAFKDGAPTKAAEGFARKNGVELSALKKADTEKGDYVSAEVFEKGRSSEDVLRELLPNLLGGISFRKSMRWGDGEHAFGRPVQWLIAMLGETVLPVEFGGVTASNVSRGHRFLAPEEFPVSGAAEYVGRLREASVVVDMKERRTEMERALHQAAADCGGVLVDDAFLLEECATLVERPFVVPGSFEARFLDLPEEVVISVMRDHQRYFALRDPSGKLLPRYLNVVNTANAPESIAKGNDRVLKARLKDAAFFVVEDEKAPLLERRAKLDSVVFHRKLGTIGEKVERIATLAKTFASAFGVSEAQATEAAQLVKCDLETLIVFEFPELQGRMGRFYASREGVDAEVCAAIEEHYMPTGGHDPVAPNALGALIGICDRIDTLAGCFAVGLVPKGSADPFALRRAALGTLRSAAEGPVDVPLGAMLKAALSAFEKATPDTEETLLRFFEDRAKGLLRNEVEPDVAEASLATWVDGGHASVRALFERARALSEFRKTDGFESLAIAFKRAFNIAGRDARPWDAALLQEDEERTLVAAFEGAKERIEDAIGAEDFRGALSVIAADLRGPIDSFFDEVMVMCEDEKVRENRLALLSSIASVASQVAAFEKLQTQRSDA